jgi:hypothetical protein
LIVKVLFSNFPSKKGMSYVTYPVRERVKLSRGQIKNFKQVQIKVNPSINYLAFLSLMRWSLQLAQIGENFHLAGDMWLGYLYGF